MPLMSASQSVVRDPRARWAWLGLIVLWNAAFLAPLFGPMMHESDQASLLEGAVSIAQTGQLGNHAFYNYDKQFGSYWIVATVLRFLGATPDPNAVVLAGNAVSVVFFNAGLVLLSLSVTSPATLLLLGCLLFAPSFLVHAPFLAGNYLSAFFLFAQFIALRKPDSIVLPLLFAFCATACRADAVLAQPILLWSSTRAESLSRLVERDAILGMRGRSGSGLLAGQRDNRRRCRGFESRSPFSFMERFWRCTLSSVSASESAFCSSASRRCFTRSPLSRPPGSPWRASESSSPFCVLCRQLVQHAALDGGARRVDVFRRQCPRSTAHLPAAFAESLEFGGVRSPGFGRGPAALGRFWLVVAWYTALDGDSPRARAQR